MYNSKRLIHGDISIDNIVIVRFLPSSCASVGVEIGEADDTGIPYVGIDGEIHRTDAKTTLGPDGFPCDLGSGGKLIDYEYT